MSEPVAPTEDKIETPPKEESTTKKGFMLSVEDIINPEPPPKEEPVTKREVTARDILGSGTIGDMVGRLESDEYKEAVENAEKPIVEDKEKPAPEPLKVVREKPVPPPTPPAQPPRELPKQHIEPQAVIANEAEKGIIDALDGKQKADLDFITEAETVNDEFKGKRKELLEYYGRLDSKIRKLREDDPDMSLDESDDLREFIDKNKPKFDETSVNKAKEDLLIRKTQNTIRGEYDKKLRDLELRPKVESKSKEYVGKVYDSISGSENADLKEVMDVINENGGGEKGVAAARALFPEETDAVMSVYNESSQLGESLIALREGLIGFDATNPIHTEAGNRVIQYDNAMLDPKNAKHHARDGKQFKSSSEFYALNAQTRDQQYWTFSTDEILSFIAEDTRRKAEGSLKQERVRLENIAQRVAKRSGINLEIKNDNADADKEREEAGESASVSPTRSTGSDTKGGAEDGDGKFKFMLHAKGTQE